MVPVSSELQGVSSSPPELRAVLLAVDKAGSQAVASLCSLSGVSEHEFRAILSSSPGHDLEPARRRELENKLLQALGLNKSAQVERDGQSMARDQWPDTPLKQLQMLRGVQTVQRPQREEHTQPNWPTAVALILYVLISLSYALGLHGQF